MKHMRIFLVLIPLTVPLATATFSAQTPPFAFQRRYNANSFIFNSKSYYTTYKPKKQLLGRKAIKHMEEKQAFKKIRKPRRLNRSASSA